MDVDEVEMLLADARNLKSRIVNLHSRMNNLGVNAKGMGEAELAASKVEASLCKWLQS